uniref:Capsid protein G8P n=1 Tax=Thermus phage PH75 TaxID=144736 RepID=CAPSD_BPH75|nr:RecName: Full=Capsid protein G8P; AltName: Full=Coat protein B; AltName: Full=Gene 8 protein; Short=G8P; AltName: Full=Major coat protein [Thermus phage PH75]1HGV_A Chain A, PH75 INOVIRUS MAJOR COAT PROTEIN [Thermus phage PH75]1HGZ_A Chain A, PH75 INOVIRUS MAJOR COAT PROTEIN [Thermus phage PH75]1HH0_A Chain A, PH75 INOVIRUS MAJOR COAT PROTEIN [Thermus phage PH75]
MDFNPSEVASQVTNYIQAIAAAGVGVLALAIGLSAAWKYAKRFLKG